MGPAAIASVKHPVLFSSWLLLWLLMLAACNPVTHPAGTDLAPLSVTVTAVPSRSPLPSQTPAPSATIVSPISSATSLPTASPTAQFAHLSIENVPILEEVGTIRYDPWNLVLALEWSPDGEMLAVAAGNAVYIYAGSDLSQVQILDEGAWTSGLAFSPNGSLLAAGSRDGELRIWRTTGNGSGFEAQPALQWTAHKKGINQISFSSDGRYLASGGNDAIARVWNTASGSLEQQMIGGTFAIPALAFQPDGSYLAVVNGPLARLREIETGQIGVTLRGAAPLFSLAFRPDGQEIATGNLENQLEIWDAIAGERITVLESGNSGVSTATAFSGQVAYSPDGSLLGATASDGSIQIWAPAAGQLLVRLAGHNRAATSLAFAPDQSRLASGGLDATVRIWEIP